jgi:BTB/POZ domain
LLSLLPLYSDPYVKIRIGSGSDEYKLSKALLCKQSPYFAATFQGNFREGEEQSTTLAEIDGVVSVRSFELLAQWLYLGRVNFGGLTSEEAITATIEFVRFADMRGVTGMESMMAGRIKATINDNAATPSKGSVHASDPDTNTHCITSRHIKSAALLPHGHPVRGILARAAVKGYLQHDSHKFLREKEEIPSFSVDLLQAVKSTLRTLTCSKSSIGFKDPISGETFPLSPPIVFSMIDFGTGFVNAAPGM